MTRIGSRTLAALIAGFLLITAGCTTYSAPGAPESEASTRTLTTAETTTAETTAVGTTSAEVTPAPEGDIRVYEANDVPSGVTVVNATDERIREVEPLQDALERAVRSETNSSSVHVTGGRFTETDEALDEIEGYTGTEAPTGDYVRKNGTVFVVFIAVYE